MSIFWGVLKRKEGKDRLFVRIDIRGREAKETDDLKELD
jgi:hypothetical protein